MADSDKKTVISYEGALPFEKPLAELENRAENADTPEERKRLRAELVRERECAFADLSAWQRVELARHPLRPRMLDYTTRILDDLVELHGDRLSGDDPAMVTGIGRFQGETIMVVGQHKGVSTQEKIERNFGMALPEGYRKALRMFQMAERFHLPIVSFVDTPAAHPGVEAEERGQGPAIARNLLEASRIATPIFAAVISEGGSGGALGIAVADWIVMLEHAVYMICPPERCAEILWRDVERKDVAAAALRVTAAELLELGIIDSVLPEPGGGAHRDPDGAAAQLTAELDRFLAGCKRGKWTPVRRQQKFRRMGVFKETLPSAGV